MVRLGRVHISNVLPESVMLSEAVIAEGGMFPITKRGGGIINQLMFGKRFVASWRVINSKSV
jgi:hypothetical protein